MYIGGDEPLFKIVSNDLKLFSSFFVMLCK